MKNNLQNEAGSLKNIIPINTAPTAPIPVHTGYTVPKGRCSEALAIRNILIPRAKRKPPHQYHNS